MCLLVVHNAGASPMSTDELCNAWESNSDGAGYAFADSGKLVIRKGFMRLKKFVRSYAQDIAKYGDKSAFMVHFRWATHGHVNKKNCHPFAIGDDIAFAHNGVLSFVAPRKDESDTACFARTVLAHRHPETFIHDDTFAKILENMIGNANKLAFVDSSGRARIIGERLGLWQGGTWFSNNSHTYASIASASWPVSKNVDARGLVDVYDDSRDLDHLTDDEWKLAKEEWYRQRAMNETEDDSCIPAWRRGAHRIG